MCEDVFVLRCISQRVNCAEGFPMRAASTEAWRSRRDQEPVRFDLSQQVEFAMDLLLVNLCGRITDLQEKVPNLLDEV